MGGFHPMLGLTEQERKRRPNAREFQGDGTPYLRVPDLVALDPENPVRVGTLDLPDTITHKVPLDATLTNFDLVTEPLVALDHAPDGCPVLLRNIVSNDGMWQAGVPVYVSGEWEDDPKPKAKAKPKADGEAGGTGEGGADGAAGEAGA